MGKLLFSFSIKSLKKNQGKHSKKKKKKKRTWRGVGFIGHNRILREVVGNGGDAWDGNRGLEINAVYRLLSTVSFNTNRCRAKVWN